MFTTKVNEERFQKIMKAFSKPVEDLEKLVKDAEVEEERLREEANRIEEKTAAVVAVKIKTRNRVEKFKDFFGI